MHAMSKVIAKCCKYFKNMPNKIYYHSVYKYGLQYFSRS